MIQANELRIGSLVLGSGKIIVMCTLSMEDIIWACSEDCQPIPLTPEILEKAGFEREDKNKNGGGTYSVFSKYPLTFNTIHGWWAKGQQYDNQPSYVHQLQNLYYSLTGEELTINL